VATVWRDEANDLRGRAIDCGHFLAEERPQEVLAELAAFIGSEQVQLVTIARLAADHLEAGARSEPGPRGRDSVPHLSAGSLVGLAYQSLDEIEQVLHHERLGQKG